MKNNWGLEIKNNWDSELVASELEFWNSWFKTKGLHWPEDYRFRLDRNTELQEWIKHFVIETKGTKILDVGSGPLTVLGKNFNREPLNITCCDALGDSYQLLLTEYAIDVQRELWPVACDMEAISEQFEANSFDLVHAQNCVDHSYDPMMAIHEMITVCKTKGIVLLRHEENEAEREGYSGLHQWNFVLENGEFGIKSKYGIQFVHRILQDIWGDRIAIKSHLKDGYIITIIWKLT